MGTKLKPVKIFHCADIHLDSPFSLLDPSHSYKRRLELQNAAASAINYAKDSKAQLFLIAGDLFDSEYVTKETIEFLFGEIRKAKDCKFFIAPGNHDAFTETSPYALLQWPENVHIFKEKSRVELDDIGVDVYGFGFTSPTLTESPIKGYPPLREDRINILVCHGDISSPISPYGPILRGDIESSGFDYIALGHIHSSEGVQVAGRTSYAYPGCIEGRDFGETGYKGALVGEVVKGEANLKGIRFSRRRYEIITLSLDGFFTAKECIDYIKGQIKEYKEDTALRIILEGSIPEGFIISPAQLDGGQILPYYIEIVDKTVPNIRFTELESENTLRGVFYRLAIENIDREGDNDERRKVLTQALKYGLNALDDRNIIDF